MNPVKVGLLGLGTVGGGTFNVLNRNAEEITRLNRRLLAVQEDNSVTYVTVGHTKGLYDLLVSRADDVSPLVGRELIERKVRRWVALGALQAKNTKGSYGKDWNFFHHWLEPALTLPGGCCSLSTRPM